MLAAGHQFSGGGGAVHLGQAASRSQAVHAISRRAAADRGQCHISSADQEPLSTPADRQNSLRLMQRDHKSIICAVVL